MISEQRRHSRFGDSGATGRVLLDGAPIDPRETFVAVPGVAVDARNPWRRRGRI